MSSGLVGGLGLKVNMVCGRAKRSVFMTTGTVKNRVTQPTWRVDGRGSGRICDAERGLPADSGAPVVMKAARMSVVWGRACLFLSRDKHTP